jgi:predicted ATPase/class 3 adenylate cyclase
MICAMVTAFPTGVVTLLFTDVEGSTRLLHELGDGYGEALHDHRRRLRLVIAEHEGVEVDTQGDAFFFAFAAASKAVAAAVDGQRSLAHGPIRVRMGVHTGEPRLTDEGYVGLDIHKGARIAAVGHGGQVLLSQSTHALVDRSVRDLGVHRLKDLSAPERIYQVEIDGLPCEFPPLKTIEAGMKNLPAASTSFVGRGSELDEIDRLLDAPDCRMLTLVGPGGAGKTRLALEAAARRINRYAHGVHFVPLVSVRSPEFVALAVAEAIQFSVDGTHSAFSPQDQLLDYLSERSMLLVLDNFEHLIDGSGLLSHIIERAPHVELLTTSRERLALQSEFVLDVHGLGLAGVDGTDPGALHLFRERATRVEPRFGIDDQRADVERICRLVDGLPLGIELAASWVSVLSCAEIAAEIERNLDFLATSMRDVPERHRSLRAAFDQSWRLLPDEQQSALARLSVLRGDFDRGAAVAVAGADLRLLSELVSKSLVRRPDFGRYELHELVRQYSSAKLTAESSDAVIDTRESHARHYLGALCARRSELVGKGVVQARDELRRDIANLRIAAEWAVTGWTDTEARDVLSALNAFFFAHNLLDGAETFGRLAVVATATGGETDQGGAPSPCALAATIYNVGSGAALGYDPALEQLALQCLPHLRANDMHPELGTCLLALGTTACYRDAYPEAVAYLTEAVDLARGAGDSFGEAAALSWLGFVQLLLGKLVEDARASFEASRAASERAGSPQMLAYALSKLGILADVEERYADAMRLHMEANEMFAAIGDSGGIGYTLSRASLSAYGLGDYQEALRLGRAGFDAFGEVNHRWGMMSSLCRIGFAALALGDVDDSQTTFRTALEQAHASAAISLELLALSGVGGVLRVLGEGELAATVLTYTLGHAQLPQAYRITAQPVLDALKAELPPEQLAAAHLAAANTTHQDLVRLALEPRPLTLQLK